MLTLYYSEKSCSYAPHILLYETGVDFVAKRIDFDLEEQNSTYYHRVNPKGRIPALMTPQGVLTENPAILLYIAQIYPERSLAPKEPFELAKAQDFNMYIASTIHVGHAHKHRGSRWVDNQEALACMKIKVAENMASYAKVIEDHFFMGPWVLGENFSMCDAYLSLVTRWLKNDGVSLENFQKLKDHDDLMRSRSSVQEALQIYR